MRTVPYGRDLESVLIPGEPHTSIIPTVELTLGRPHHSSTVTSLLKACTNDPRHGSKVRPGTRASSESGKRESAKAKSHRGRHHLWECPRKKPSKPFLLDWSHHCYCFQTGSDYITQAGLELIFFCSHLLSAESTGLCYCARPETKSSLCLFIRTTNKFCFYLLGWYA